jgi:hypothetical protein
MGDIYMRIRTRLFAFLAIVSCAGVANGTTWNPAADWSLDNNPNGVWTYGFQTTLADPLTPYDFPEPLEGGQWQWWHSFTEGDQYTPGMGQNVGPGYIVGYVPPGKIMAHPGPGTDGGVPGNEIKGQYTTLRWTAPADGLYDVSVLFEGIANIVGAGQLTTTDVHVLINGTDEFSGIVDGYVGGDPREPDPAGPSPSQFWRQIVDLNVNDTVDFAVGDGENLSYYSDMTSIVASISTWEGPLLGDFNTDNAVDAADYIVWRDMGGTLEQYNDWTANYGLSVPTTGAGAVNGVPEPGTSLLVGIVIAAALAPGVRFR